MGVAFAMADAGLRENHRWKRNSVPDAPDNGRSPNSTWQDSLKRCGLVLDWRSDLAAEVLAERMALAKQVPERPR